MAKQSERANYTMGRESHRASPRMSCPSLFAFPTLHPLTAHPSQHTHHTRTEAHYPACKHAGDAETNLQ